ncbi:MAG: hypothetical protein K6C06_00795, partial [Lachnospiraceae bacterium]|nr:hypothetical protein [Lachnospiraceae bacterium]
MAICGNCFNQVAEGAFCDICGFNNAKNAELYPTALPIGSVLNQRFVVGRVLGQGGFGVTYLAQDAQTRMRVAIKEYFPTDFVMRV